MKFIAIIFPAIMILLPAAVISLIPANPNAQTDLPRARRLLLWMWVASFCGIALWLLAYLLVTPLLGPMTAWSAWVLFFPLWFCFGVPILKARSPNWVSTPPPDVQVRAASLTPRDQQPAISPWATRAPWIVWSALFVVVLLLVDWSVITASDEALFLRRKWAVAAILIITTAVFSPLFTGVFLRKEPQEPQPLDPSGSLELINLYAARTRQRAMLFTGLAIAMTIMFGSMAAIMAIISRGYWSDQSTPTILGWTGSLAGTLIGIAGGIAGIMSSAQAAKINARLRELTQASA